MGGPNKLLMPVDDQPMVRRAFDQLSTAGFSEIIVVTGRDQAEVAALLPGDGSYTLVHNARFAEGMTTSIQKGVEAAHSQAYMICLADMPLLNSSHYEHLLKSYGAAYKTDTSSILLPIVNTKRGNPVIFSGQYRQQILAHQDMTGCRAIVQQNKQHLVLFESADKAYLTDIDTPEDYQALKP